MHPRGGWRDLIERMRKCWGNVRRDRASDRDA